MISLQVLHSQPSYLISVHRSSCSARWPVPVLFGVEAAPLLGGNRPPSPKATGPAVPLGDEGGEAGGEGSGGEDDLQAQSIDEAYE